jgi:hypothetical protein
MKHNQYTFTVSLDRADDWPEPLVRVDMPERKGFLMDASGARSFARALDQACDEIERRRQKA